MKPTVILLAAGKSSRMKPLSDKMLFKYLGKTVLAYQLDSLLSSGLDDFIIIGNKENISEIEKCLNKDKKKNVQIKFAIQKDLSRGIMGGVLAAKALVKPKKPILIISSNDFVEKEIFKKVVDKADNSNSDILIVGKVVEKYFPGGYLELNGKNRITRIVEKPKPGTEPSNLINLVIQYFKNSSILFETYKKCSNNNDDAHELAIQKLLDKGVSAEVVNYSGFWQALKYPWHHLELKNRFLSTLKKTFIHKSAQVSKNAVINGQVYISEDVKIFDFAVIQGPVFIGKKTIIGNHTLIRNSQIGDNCVIGHATEVSRSYLGDHVWTHQNYIGDSVIDENVSFGAGTRTGNLRLDEGDISVIIKDQKINSGLNKIGSFIGKNVRVGINSSIMPGIKIGEDSFIGAGMVVEKDITPKNFLKGNFPAKERENKCQILKRSGI